MALLRKLAALATVAEVARRYAKNNPEKAGRFLDQAASFVDKQTKGKYHNQIDDVARKAKNVAGIQAKPSHDVTGNGYNPAPPSTPKPASTNPTTPQ